MENTILSGTEFKGCDLTNTNFSNTLAENTAFRNCIIKNTNFTDATLSYATFTTSIIDKDQSCERTFINTNFENADLLATKFHDINFDKANFTNAAPKHALFENCICEDSKFINANFLYAKLINSTFKLCDCKNADLKDELRLIYKKIDNILDPSLSLFKTDKNEKTGEKQLPVERLSSSIQIFYLIKSLIDNVIIIKNSTLILDEPETHLHPNLQITLAEIIVLIQKTMKLHILTNTYSPYFLRAIDVFSEKYGIEDTTKYYLAYNDGDNAKVKDVTLNISEIYKELSDPLQRLENEGYEKDI